MSTTQEASPSQLSSPQDLEAVENFRTSHRRLRHEMAKAVVGQEAVVDEILIAIFTRSHALLVGVPGLAKTLMISTLAQTLQLGFKRIQFTPDLMPSDITGTEVIAQDPATGERAFRFLPGPLFTNILLADEINRTPPKTQAAMLEAMQERRVTVGGTTHRLPEPFFVLATQNPLEQEGTYPLPEAQLDRFMFLIRVDYPTAEEELAIMKMGTVGAGAPEAVLGADEIMQLQTIVKRIPVAEHIYQYAETIVRGTRPQLPEAFDFAREWVSWGAGPRASLSLIQAAKAHALIQGQTYVGCDNVAAVAPSILRHRLVLNFSAQSEGITTEHVVARILEQVPRMEKLG